MFAFFSVLKQHLHRCFNQIIRKEVSNCKCRREQPFRRSSMVGVKVLSQAFHLP